MSLIASAGVGRCGIFAPTMNTRVLFCFSLLCALLLFAAAPLRAASLYTGEAVIEPSERPERAALRALDEVLVRLTGLTEGGLVETLDLQPSILRQLVSSEQRIRRAWVGPDDWPQDDQLRLRIDFDPAAVDALLARHALPRLGRERPSILLWLAVEDERGVEWVGSAYVEQAISEQARRLGLDVVRPLGDLIDRFDLDVADIRGGFLDAAATSARRYGTQVIAMLDLRAIGGPSSWDAAGEPLVTGDAGVGLETPPERIWQARWLWRLEGRDAGLVRTAADPAQAVAAGLESLLGALVERFGVVADTAHAAQGRVLVSGIETEIQYAEVLRHLQSLSAVADVLVLGARGSEFEFQLRLRSPGLEDGLGLGGVLAIDGRKPDGSLVLRLLR